MFDPTKFAQASERIELWPNTVAMIATLGSYDRDGSSDAAFRRLVIALKREDFDREHSQNVLEYRDELACVSDGALQWEGRGRCAIWTDPNVIPQVWSSAHEAAIGMYDFMFTALIDPIADVADESAARMAFRELLAARWKALTLSSSEIAILQERIRRERAKLVSRFTETRGVSREIVAISSDPPSESEKLRHRLEIDFTKQLAILDGHEYDIQSEPVLYWLKALSDRPGEWISNSALRSFKDSYFRGSPPRTDKFREYLRKCAPEIELLIDAKTGPGGGSRLRLSRDTVIGP